MRRSKKAPIQESLSNFQVWFRTFLEEKEIDMSEILRWNGKEMVQVGDVCQAIFDTTPSEQSKIMDTLVIIDFKNASVLHYFKHLAQAL